MPFIYENSQEELDWENLDPDALFDMIEYIYLHQVRMGKCLKIILKEIILTNGHF